MPKQHKAKRVKVQEYHALVGLALYVNVPACNVKGFALIAYLDQQVTCKRNGCK